MTEKIVAIADSVTVGELATTHAALADTVPLSGRRREGARA